MALKSLRFARWSVRGLRSESQILIALRPILESLRRFLRSRLALAKTFAVQSVSWCGLCILRARSGSCQNLPSTNTASPWSGSQKSGQPGRARWLRRCLTPQRTSHMRTTRSGRVSRHGPSLAMSGKPGGLSRRFFARTPCPAAR